MYAMGLNVVLSVLVNYGGIYEIDFVARLLVDYIARFSGGFLTNQRGILINMQVIEVDQIIEPRDFFVMRE